MVHVCTHAFVCMWQHVDITVSGITLNCSTLFIKEESLKQTQNSPIELASHLALGILSPPLRMEFQEDHHAHQAFL